MIISPSARKNRPTSGSSRAPPDIEHERAVAEFGEDTRESTFERAAVRIRDTRHKISSYAEYLGLNGDDVVAIFNEQWNRSAHRVEPALAQTPVSVARAPTGLFSLWVALACLLLAGSTVVYVMGGSGGGHAAPPPPTTHPPATQPVTGSTTSASQSPPSGQPAGVRMTVTATQGSCWLEARRGSASGALLAERTLAPGQVVHLHGRRVWLRLGDPTSVRLRVNGTALANAYPAQPINLLVTPQGARQL